MQIIFAVLLAILEIFLVQASYCLPIQIQVQFLLEERMFKTNGISFVKTENRCGPRQLPWGIPHSKLLKVCVVVFRMTQKHYLEGQVYSVPLIQPDLRREEAVNQIADALLYLETISTDIFKRQTQHTFYCPLYHWLEMSLFLLLTFTKIVCLTRKLITRSIAIMYT